jgi:hypothetical protein
VADINNLRINTGVMAPLGSAMHKGIIVEPPADHPTSESMVCVKFTPPVPDTQKPNHSSTYLTCEADRLELGWSDPRN